MEFPPASSSEISPQEFVELLDKATLLAPEENAQLVYPSWFRITYLTDNGQISIQVPKLFENLHDDFNDDEDFYVSDQLTIAVTTFDEQLGTIQPATIRQYSLNLLDGTSEFRQSIDMYDIEKGEVLRRAPISIEEEIVLQRNGAFGFTQQRLAEVYQALDTIDPARLK